VQVGALARGWFAVTALVVLTGVVVQLFVTADLDTGFFDQRWERVLNVFAFFTIQSNLLVMITTGMLALGLARPTTSFRTLRLTALVAISLTFVVFHAVLRDLQDLTGDAAFADFLLHTLSPVLCVSGWLLFGPRGQTSSRVAALTLVFLLAWGTFTLVRGEIVGWYPYPFMDVVEKGYARVAVNLALVAAVFVAFAFGAHRLDRWLTARRASAGQLQPA
jgi:hypothetical protein